MINKYLLKTVFISIPFFPIFTPAFIWAVSFNDTAWLKTIMEESTGERVTINGVTIVRKGFFSPSAYKVSFSFKYRLPKRGHRYRGRKSLHPSRIQGQPEHEVPTSSLGRIFKTGEGEPQGGAEWHCRFESCGGPVLADSG